MTFTQCCHCWIPKQRAVIPTSHSELQEWDQPNQSTSLPIPSQPLAQPAGPWEPREKLANLAFATRWSTSPLIAPSSTIGSAEHRTDSLFSPVCSVLCCCSKFLTLCVCLQSVCHVNQRVLGTCVLPSMTLGSSAPRVGMSCPDTDIFSGPRAEFMHGSVHNSSSPER